MKTHLSQLNRCWKLYKKFASQKYSDDMFNLFNRDYGRLLADLEKSPMRHVAFGIGNAIDQVWTESCKEEKHIEP